MSKEKCRISKKKSNFSMISNAVAQALNYNLEALGLYIYLFSLPDDWTFYKSHLRKVCNIGEKKLNKLLKLLSAHKLVNSIQIRKENGQFSHFDIHIDDGNSFIHNPQPDGQNDRTVENGAAVKQSYKENIKAFKKEDKKQERAAARKQRVPLPIDFQPNAEATALADKKGLDLFRTLSGFRAHAKAEGWLKEDWQQAFLKWVINERKTTSIMPELEGKIINRNVNELKSTVTWFNDNH